MQLIFTQKFTLCIQKAYAISSNRLNIAQYVFNNSFPIFCSTIKHIISHTKNTTINTSILNIQTSLQNSF